MAVTSTTVHEPLNNPQQSERFNTQQITSCQVVPLPEPYMQQQPVLFSPPRKRPPNAMVSMARMVDTALPRAPSGDFQDAVQVRIVASAQTDRLKRPALSDIVSKVDFCLLKEQLHLQKLLPCKSLFIVVHTSKPVLSGRFSPSRTCAQYFTKGHFVVHSRSPERNCAFGYTSDERP
jgi:hypothetical protein